MGAISGGSGLRERRTRLHNTRKAPEDDDGIKTGIGHPLGNIRLAKRVHRGRAMTVDADSLAELETRIKA